MKILDGAPKTFRGTEWNPAIVAAVGSIPNAPHCWGLFDTSLPLGYPQKRSRFWCLEIQTNLPQQLQICAEYHKEYTSTQRERELCLPIICLSSIYLSSIIYHQSICRVFETVSLCSPGWPQTVSCSHYYCQFEDIFITLEVVLSPPPLPPSPPLTVLSNHGFALHLCDASCGRSHKTLSFVSGCGTCPFFFPSCDQGAFYHVSVTCLAIHGDKDSFLAFFFF
jgi:hypothetical protein